MTEITPAELQAAIVLQLAQRDLERLRNRWADAVEADPLGAFDQLEHLAGTVGRLEAALVRARMREVVEMMTKIRPSAIWPN